MLYAQIAILCAAVAGVACDLPPGTRRNTYLPPEPSKGGYTYDKPMVPFPRPTPSRPTATYPNTPTSGRPFPSPKPSTKFPTRPTQGYPAPGPRPTPHFPDYTQQPTTGNGNTIVPDDHHHHHEPGMPFDFNYAVKEASFGNDYSHNAISDGDVVRGEYRVQLPDGRLQVVRYTADWKHGFSAQVSYDGNPRAGTGAGAGAGGGGGGGANFRGY